MKHLFTALMVAMLLVSSQPAHAEIVRFVEFDAGKWRGSQPENGADYQKLKDLGVQTIINLRTGGIIEQERQVAARMGFKYVSVPMSSFKSPGKSKIDGLLAALSDSANGKVFVHCAHGQDRTGLVVGMYRVKVQHWKADAAYAEMKSLNFHDELIGLSSYYWTHTGNAAKGTLKFIAHLFNPFDGHHGAAKQAADVETDDQDENDKNGENDEDDQVAPDAYGDDDGG